MRTGIGDAFLAWTRLQKTHMQAHLQPKAQIHTQFNTKMLFGTKQKSPREEPRANIRELLIGPTEAHNRRDILIALTFWRPCRSFLKHARASEAPSYSERTRGASDSWGGRFTNEINEFWHAKKRVSGCLCALFLTLTLVQKTIIHKFQVICPKV